MCARGDLCRGRSEPLLPSTRLLLWYPTTDGAAGTRCLDSGGGLSELPHDSSANTKLGKSSNTY